MEAGSKKPHDTEQVSYKHMLQARSVGAMMFGTRDSNAILLGLLHMGWVETIKSDIVSI